MTPIKSLSSWQPVALLRRLAQPLIGRDWRRLVLERMDMRHGAICAIFVLSGSFVTYQLISHGSAAAPAVGAVEVQTAIGERAGGIGGLGPQQLVPLTAEEAIAANALVPVAPGEEQPGMSLHLTDADETFQTAANCLAAAIYYEAGVEPVDGQRAVAQVVINRVHHPAFPRSVCGVVFQGSKRRTGCQFTFTCDGSLSRKPAARLWAGAELVASEALSGTVYQPVGLSTHYHADYVVPYWASSLAKTATIGRHIFYRWKGRNGTRPAFVQPYGSEAGAPGGMAGLDGEIGGAGVSFTRAPAVVSERPMLDLTGSELEGGLDKGTEVLAGPPALEEASRPRERFVIPMPATDLE